MGQSPGSEVEATRDNERTCRRKNPETRFEASKREARGTTRRSGARARPATRPATPGSRRPSEKSARTRARYARTRGHRGRPARGRRYRDALTAARRGSEEKRSVTLNRYPARRLRARANARRIRTRRSRGPRTFQSTSTSRKLGASTRHVQSTGAVATSGRARRLAAPRLVPDDGIDRSTAGNTDHDLDVGFLAAEPRQLDACQTHASISPPARADARASGSWPRPWVDRPRASPSRRAPPSDARDEGSSDDAIKRTL